MRSLIQSLREEVNQIRESNAFLFRATANEMDLLREDNGNLTTVMVKLKADFDLMVSNFLEQGDKIRELEAWRMHVENRHIPNHGRGAKNDQEDTKYDEFLDDQNESHRNENIQVDEEEENNQKQANSANEDGGYIAITPKSITNEEYELAENVEVSTEIESMNDESLVASNLVVVHDQLFDDLALNDATIEDQKKADLKEEYSMEIDLAVRDLAIQGLAVEMGSTDEECIEKEHMETDAIKIDLATSAIKKEKTMEVDLTKKDSAVQCLAEERDPTNKESLDKEYIETDSTEIYSSKEGEMAEKELAIESSVVTGSTNKAADEESTDKASSETGLAKVDLKKEDAMEIVLVQQGLAAKGSSEEMELVNNKPTKDSSLKDDSKTDGFLENDLAQTDIAVSYSLKEKESIDKQSSNANLTETGTIEQDSMKSKAAPEPIKMNVSADEKEFRETNDLKGENEIKSKELAHKEPANDKPTDLVSNKKDSIDRDSNKEESAEPELTEKGPKKEEATLNHSVAETLTEVSIQKCLKETTAMESNEKDVVQTNSNDQEAAIANEVRDSAPNKDQKTSSPQIPVSDQVTNDTSISKLKRKYKNPIVLIKSKRQKLSLKQL